MNDQMSTNLNRSTHIDKITIGSSDSELINFIYDNALDNVAAAAADSVRIPFSRLLHLFSAFHLQI